MKPEEARDLFSEAYDETLDDERRRAFEQVIAHHPDLRAEYELFCDALRATRALSSESPDLLGDIQRELRVRSGGRFYRDRFAAQSRGQVWLVIVAAVIVFATLVAILLTLYLADVQALPPASGFAPDAGVLRR